jgi:Fe-S-cluster containining protein
MIVKDLDVIRNQSKMKEDQNWRFRSYLKMQDDKKIDSFVKPIYEFVIKNIDCLECGNCCRKLRPAITNEDICKFEKEFGLSEDEIIVKYIETDEFNELRLKGSPCVFLDGNECKIYQNRPEDCKSYPHLHKKRFTTRLMGIIENTEVCPIVYNVYEELKAKINFR